MESCLSGDPDPIFKKKHGLHSPHKNPPVCPPPKKKKIQQTTLQRNVTLCPLKASSCLFPGGAFAELQSEKPEEARSCHKSSIGASCPFLPRQGVRSLLQKTWGFFGWIFGKQSNGFHGFTEWIHAICPWFFNHPKLV